MGQQTGRQADSNNKKSAEQSSCKKDVASLVACAFKAVLPHKKEKQENVAATLPPSSGIPSFHPEKQFVDRGELSNIENGLRDREKYPNSLFNARPVLPSGNDLVFNVAVLEMINEASKNGDTAGASLLSTYLSTVTKMKQTSGQIDYKTAIDLAKETLPADVLTALSNKLIDGLERHLKDIGYQAK